MTEKPPIKRRPAVSFLPATAVLEMTYRCNHQCLFCSCPWEHPDGRFERMTELTTEEWKQAISRLCAMGVSNLAFTGGEPLLRSDLFEIIRHAAGCSTEHVETVNGSLVSRFGPPKLYLLSNGRLVDDVVLELCTELDIQLSMSLPGLETFAAHTGYDGADHVLRQFEAAKSLGLKTVVGVTVTRINLFELERTLGAALLAGATQVLLNRFLPGGRGIRNAERLLLSSEEIIRMLETTESILAAAGRFGSVGTELPLCILNGKTFKHLQVGTRCSAAVDFFAIGPGGFTRVCNHSPTRLAHVNRIEDLKKNNYWRRFSQKKYLPEECHGCGDTRTCDGGCREAAHVVFGRPDAPDPLMGRQ